MIVLCTGIIRSGSTWSFNIVKSIINEKCKSGKILSKYEEDIKKIIENEAFEYENIVLKCHDVNNFGKALIKHKCVKVVCTYRHPLETIVSGMQVFNQQFDGMLNAVKRSYDFLQFQAKNGDACLIKYDDIVNNSLDVIKKINVFLQTDVDIEKLKEMDTLFNKENMRKMVNKMSKYDKDMIDGRFSPYHKENLFHLNHIRNDDALSWQKYLSDEQKEKAKEILKDYWNNF